MGDTNIYLQLAKAQAEFKAVPKNGKNPHFKSTYATLDDIIQYTTPILAKYELSVTHVIQDMSLITTLHYIEQSVSSSMPFGGFLNGSKNTLHQLGSAMTYIKRYNIAALLNIALGDDIDGGGESDFTGVPIAELPWLNFPRGNAQNKQAAMIELFYDPILANNLNPQNIVSYYQQTHRLSNEMKDYLVNNAVHDAMAYGAHIDAQLDQQTYNQEL